MSHANTEGVLPSPTIELEIIQFIRGEGHHAPSAPHLPHNGTSKHVPNALLTFEINMVLSAILIPGGDAIRNVFPIDVLQRQPQYHHKVSKPLFGSCTIDEATHKSLYNAKYAHHLWYLVSHTIFAKGPELDVQRSQSVTPANCQYDFICQHKVTSIK